MKTIMKYVYVALLLIGLGLSSCTQNEWAPGAPESKNCYNVYFPEQIVSGDLEVDPTDALEFTVTICRENVEGDVTVPLNIDLNTEGKFTVSKAEFFDGSDELMIKSLKRLIALDGNYRVLPGHNRETTLESERTRNWYIRRMVK